MLISHVSEAVQLNVTMAERKHHLFVFALIGLCLSVETSGEFTPLQMAQAVADRLYVNKDTFFHWEYGNAVIFDALYESDEIFHMNYTVIIESYLDQWLQEPTIYGYKILHKEAISFEEAVGDTVGLFTINYLNRILKDPLTVKFNRTAYLEIVKYVVRDFIESWPYRLPDGTFSRLKGWAPPTIRKNASFIWADDQYMGLTLLARYAVVSKDVRMAQQVGEMALHYARYLQDGQDMLSYHGYDYNGGGVHSCCKWGRGNGWGLMSHLEVLACVQEFPQLAQTGLYDNLKKLLQEHAMAMIRHQSMDGRWHQVVDQPTTFLETSATAMTLYSLTRGVLNSWLPATIDTHNAILRAWRGLQKAVQQDGTVDGIAEGTGIGDNINYYQGRLTQYLLSGPGVGSVLHAANHMELYMKRSETDNL